MSYTHPGTVISPKHRVDDLHVIYDGGPDNWSLAQLKWDQKEALGIRWNGGEKESVGNPQSRGLPTWFILPEELQPIIKKAVEHLFKEKEQQLREGYRQMAMDESEEADAEAWADLAGETLHEEG